MWRRGQPEADFAGLTSGEPRAWSRFTARQRPAIRAAVARSFRRFGAGDRHADIEDAVQDVFLRLAAADFRLLRRFDPGRAALATWLGVIAHSAAVDALRRLRPTLPLDQAPEPEAPPERAAGPVELPPGLLTDRQVAVLRLLYDRDLDVAEVAGLLHVTEQTVRSTRHKALVRLRRHLADHQGVER